ncbi:uncharacterized protein METZ01_LOCUS93925 [marine metagenome]|jgi:uncharacterized protein (TIGR03067 family)|uniref:Uncharacterized protein n=1 Tax=marine metagenome TaxID=408172 RepID=A0A381VLY5_9ZZZZ
MAGDREAMIGTWKIAEFQDDGRDRMSRLGFRKDKKTGKESFPKLIISKDEIQVLRGDGKRESKQGLSNCAWKRCTLNETASPKTIDLVGFSGKEGDKEKTYLALYKLDGDKLVICYRETGKGRPTKFESDGHMNLMICERITTDSRGNKDVASPKGEWTRVEAICRGRTVTIKINGVIVNQAVDVFPGHHHDVIFHQNTIGHEKPTDKLHAGILVSPHATGFQSTENQFRHVKTDVARQKE